MLDAECQYTIPTEYADALNERDYGDYTGKNKWDMEQLLGEEEFTKLRRGWDYPIPHGESLKMVYKRVVPFFQSQVLPKLAEGKNVLIVSHGNALRALIKYIEQIPDADMEHIEMEFGSIRMYDLDPEGHKVNCEIRKIEETVNA